jgi:hypothetical protein
MMSEIESVGENLSALGLSPRESKYIESVLVFSGFSREEIANPKFGGAKLIAQQVEFFRERGLDPHLFVMEELISPVGILLRMAGWVRRRRMADIEFLPTRTKSDERNIWRLNLLLNLLLDYLSRIDLLTQHHVARVLEAEQNFLVIWNYSFGVFSLSKIRRKEKLGKTQVCIYEHNIEEEFYRDRIGAGKTSNLLIRLLKRVELENLSFADRVLCGSFRDKEMLQKSGISPEKSIVWIPKPYLRSKEREGSSIPSYLQEIVKGRYVVGFIGSDYGPNITAVKHLISMADSLSDSVTFLVVGSVCNWFRGKGEIPQNVVLCGFVEELNAYLQTCDAFINLKTTSDTGIEIKMLDYIGENKIIFSTAIGARGFEDYPQLIIAEIEEMQDAIRRESDKKRLQIKNREQRH